MTNITPFAFEGQQVRTVLVDGDPWFVASDVARVLGYSATEAMTRSMDSDEKGMQILQTPGGTQSVTVITEPGLYEAILRSRVPRAQDFKRWVKHEVLPQIRRTGSYVAPVEDDATLVARALVAAQGMLSAKDAQIAELEPRAEAFDVFLSADGDYLVGDAAKMLARAGVDTGPQRLFEQLHGFGWTFRGGDGKWRAKQSAVNDGYLVEKPMSHHHPRTGEPVADAPQVRVTPRGLERLRVRLGRNSLTLVS